MSIETYPENYTAISTCGLGCKFTDDHDLARYPMQTTITPATVEDIVFDYYDV
jgi:hypothetical protein